MRRLLPTYAETVDLPAAYAYPEGRPWLRAQMVSSADGAAVLEGRSGGLSGRADKRVFALTRALADVILVGASTVRVEGYRPPEIRPEFQPLRAGRPSAPPLAIVSRSLDLDLDDPAYREAKPRTIVVTARRAPAARLAAVREVADVIVAGEDLVDVGYAVDALVERGHRRLLCEGGPRLLAEVAAVGRLDELCLTLSPLLIAGSAPRILNGVALQPAQRMELAQLLEEDGFLFARYVRAPA
ncbi:hypothetical protein C3Y87_04495 [Carbonactinospora thermoautotrophica]|uniref:pyrimidine reductase family protein n=1 Tax=Carbonactinospora thermoautotrophica TaxID=1469144 RepID=UPI00226DED40|nr:pyrimidine reductase family protein [Carbonactinospora thermoautotrophica]MCX9190682.1 hypothetical protein [Carbonactinospora thermoautotrophica]